MEEKKGGVPGWLTTHEVALRLGLTDSQFRREHSQIRSSQLHQRGPRLFKIEDVEAYLQEVINEK